MPAGNWLGPRTSWRLAFLLSALLHGLAIGAFSLVPGPSVAPAAVERDISFTVAEIGPEGGGTETIGIFPHPGAKHDWPAKSTSARNGPASPPQPIPGFNPKLIDDPPTGTQGGAHSGPNQNQGTNVPGSSGGGIGSGVGSANGPGTGSGFFHIPLQGQRFVYVIDRSSSMGLRGALTIAKRELLASLQALPETAYFQIIVYNSMAHPLLEDNPDWLAVTAANKQRVALALAELDATRGTIHDRALPMALALQPDVIFFLTDADDLSPAYLAEITRRNQGRAIIHAIELSTGNVGRADAALQVFARANHGTYRAVDLDQLW